MQAFKSPFQIREYSSKCRLNTLKIGFIPTMGALHEGHISLIKASKEENDITISSVFVNPTQFNDPKDFDKYPRQVNSDLDKLAKAGCDVAFVPSVTEIYPEPDTTIYELGEISTIIEGAHRPGHFNGVASVVKRLFEIVLPDTAYFGLKDYQQYLIIKNLVKNYGFEINVAGCPIVRENSGLAMSSRNQLLSPSGKETASHLFEALNLIQKNQNGSDSESLEKLGSTFLNNYKDIELEYLLVVDRETLKKPISASRPRIALIAARVEGVRLIDNMFLKD